MKNLTLLFFINLFFVFTLFAQDSDKEAQQQLASAPQPSQSYHFFRIGLKGAPSLAWLKPNSDNYTGNGSKIGFSYGLMTDFFFSENYAFSSGLDVSYYGGKLKYSRDINANGSFHSEYLEIPLTLKMRTKEYGFMSFFAQFGFSLGARLSSKEDWANTTASTSEANTNISSQSNFFRLAFLISAGTEYSLKGSTRLVGSVFFNNGLTRFIDTSYKDVANGQFGDSKSKNNSLGIALGVFF